MKSKKRIIGVIPARMGATRFPGKPLEKILGKPMIQWVIEGVQQSQRLEKIIVATDHSSIVDLSESLGVEAVMTPTDLPTGTDRIFFAVKDLEFDVVINIQGDEPLIKGSVIDPLAGAFDGEPAPEMATLAQKISLEELNSPNVVKVVVNSHGRAMYFSRFPIPHSRLDASSLGGVMGCFKHIGLYAYSKNFLKRFCETEPALIEKAEALEQLRALDLGAQIQVLQTESPMSGIDTPEDLKRLENWLRSKGIS